MEKHLRDARTFLEFADGQNVTKEVPTHYYNNVLSYVPGVKDEWSAFEPFLEVTHGRRKSTRPDDAGNQASQHFYLLQHG
ncbi:MAG: hypothetical protein ACI3XQ_11615, partial [Eubacteriales bacterium]